jgi:hypothetical protein
MRSAQRSLLRSQSRTSLLLRDAAASFLFKGANPLYRSTSAASLSSGGGIAELEDDYVTVGLPPPGGPPGANSAGRRGPWPQALSDGSFMREVYHAESLVSRAGAHRFSPARLAAAAALLAKSASAQAADRSGANIISNAPGAVKIIAQYTGQVSPIEAASPADTAAVQEQIAKSPPPLPSPIRASASAAATGELASRPGGTAAAAAPQKRRAPTTASSHGGSMSGGHGGGGGGGSTSVLRGLGGQDDRDYLSPDAADALLRRVRVLRLPPLPPNLGRLQKFSDPPVGIIAHAARVANGVAQHDSWTSAAVGVGGGAVALSVPLDEEPRPEQDGAAEDAAEAMFTAEERGWSLDAGQAEAAVGGGGDASAVKSGLASDEAAVGTSPDSFSGSDEDDDSGLVLVPRTPPQLQLGVGPMPMSASVRMPVVGGGDEYDDDAEGFEILEDVRIPTNSSASAASAPLQPQPAPSLPPPPASAATVLVQVLCDAS